MGNYLGKSIKRADGLDHVTGRTVFVDDLSYPGMLHVKVLTSPVHRGLLRGLDLSRARALPGVAAVISARDLPTGLGYGRYLDQPVFPATQIRFQGERLAAVAAEDEDTAQEAVALIRADIEEQEPLFDPEQARDPGRSMGRPEGNLWERFNHGDRHLVVKGQAQRELDRADLVVKGAYHTGWNDQAPLEPQCALAKTDSQGRLLIHTCSQDLFQHHVALSRLLDLPPEKVRLLGGTTGGGFGGKNDIHCDHVAGLLALATGRPVKYRLTREEETRFTTKRGSFQISYTDGVMRDGRITARLVEVIHDTGAYAGMGPYGVEKFSVMASGPYHIPHFHFAGSCVFTNKPPASTMRGFAIINAAAACEPQMDRVAEALGMDPFRVRFINVWREGDAGGTGFRVQGAAGIEVMIKAAELAGIELPPDLMAMNSQER
jgi:CO/xanthine dehydrogenase Mo-binding subunit